MCGEPLVASTSIIPTGNTNYALVGLNSSLAAKSGIKMPAGATLPNVDADIDACEKIAATDPGRTT